MLQNHPIRPKIAILVRPTTPEDIPGVVALQRACFPEPFPAELLFQTRHIQSHLRLFPQGQFVATPAADPSQIIASATSMLVTSQAWHAHTPWQEITGGLALPRHDPTGDTLYGIDISVHPSFRGQGVARALYDARFELVKTAPLARYGTCCRLPGLHASGETDPLAYARSVAAGIRQDPTLTPLIRLGLTLQGVIPDYMEDPESANTAAILQWPPT